MKRCIVVFGLIASLFIASCKKEESSTTPPTAKADVITDYYKLTPGNYWVYKQYYSDTAGNIFPALVKNDSIVVKNDSIINGKTYHTLVEYNFLGSLNTNFYFRRDSADCIVNEYGAIVFTINPTLVYKEVYGRDTVAYTDCSFINTTTNITVPKGTFSCVDYKRELHRKFENYSKAYQLHSYFCKGIGKIKSTSCYVSSLQQINFELIDYYVQ